MIRKSEIAFTSLLLVIALIFLSQVMISPKDFQPVNAVDYSRGVMVIFLVAVLARLVSVIRQYRRENPTSEKFAGINMEQFKENKLSIILVSITFLLFLFYCSLFLAIGYYTTGFIVLLIYMFVLFYAQNERFTRKDVALILVASVAVVAVIYVAFSVLFELWLPRGMFI